MPPASAPTPPAVTGDDELRVSNARLPMWFCLGLAAALLVAYWPALRGGFVWDDDAHLTRPALRSVDGLRHIWSDPLATQQYYPVLHSVFWIEHRLWGDAPSGYHAANLAFHTLAALLFTRLLLRLRVSPRGALLAGALFALHPVHVESVAWITEQKNTLSTVFYLCAALAYLRYDVTRKPGAYRVALAWFVLGLLTKSVTATLPAALLVIAWWQRRRVTWKNDVRPLLPWFALSCACGLLTLWIERKLIGAEGAAFDLTLADRVVLCGRVLWFYAQKIIWPAGLVFFYPRWPISAAGVLQWLPFIAALLTLGIAMRAARHTRAPLAVLLLFAGSLFPVLGFLNVYPFQYSFVADHFQYLASLAPLALIAAILARARFALALGWLLLLPLAVLTHRQSENYHDAVTLYRATLEKNPSAWIAWNNLGRELLADPARLDEALRCFDRALALRSAYAEAHNNRGLALWKMGRPRDALPDLQEAVRLRPHSAEPRNNLGIVLALTGRPAEALAEFRAASTLNPTAPNIHENWAKALLLLNRREEAERHFAEARRLRSETAR